MKYDLIDSISNLKNYYDASNNNFHHPEMEFSPGALVVYAAYINANKIKENSCFMPHDDYLKAIAWHKALWGVDRYKKRRINKGHTYSLMTPLSNLDTVDDATTTVNDCIRSLSCENLNYYPDGILALNQVVGELHDNVWSHGISTGFSFAQRWAVPYSNSTDHYLEFALADHGKGFLAELKRAKIPGITTHEDAIRWCIQEGNSSKHANLIDEWSQRLPDGHYGASVFGEGVAVKEKDNNHQGLGLYHLLKLIKNYNGELLLATGDVCLKISHGQESYINLRSSWQGVAISCRFKISDLSAKTDKDIDPGVIDIMKQLRGEI
ncbi:TPA: hypothetical protein G8W61_003635 [Salmonella enterica]|uniref:Uncharacterized protein n=1 Tax=Salmonella enterica TaxID=28901 RepID=A0A760BGY3_SALER|nr:hypothetical protein [Salmonella enterica]